MNSSNDNRMAKKNTSKQNGLSSNEKMGIGVGITAAAAAAAGAYFLYGSKHAKKNRQKVKSWMLMAKAEALEALEKAEHMSREEYEALIDRIGAAYAVAKDTTKMDIADFKKEMKAYWSSIERTATGARKSAAKATKKSAKKVVKKVAKNTKKAVKKVSQ